MLSPWQTSTEAQELAKLVSANRHDLDQVIDRAIGFALAELAANKKDLAKSVQRGKRFATKQVQHNQKDLEASLGPVLGEVAGAVTENRIQLDMARNRLLGLEDDNGPRHDVLSVLGLGPAPILGWKTDPLGQGYGQDGSSPGGVRPGQREIPSPGQVDETPQGQGDSRGPARPGRQCVTDRPGYPFCTLPDGIIDFCEADADKMQGTKVPSLVKLFPDGATDVTFCIEWMSVTHPMPSDADIASQWEPGCCHSEVKKVDRGKRQAWIRLWGCTARVMRWLYYGVVLKDFSSWSGCAGGGLGDDSGQQGCAEQKVETRQSGIGKTVQFICARDPGEINRCSVAKMADGKYLTTCHNVDELTLQDIWSLNQCGPFFPCGQGGGGGGSGGSGGGGSGGQGGGGAGGPCTTNVTCPPPLIEVKPTLSCPPPNIEVKPVINVTVQGGGLGDDGGGDQARKGCDPEGDAVTPGRYWFDSCFDDVRRKGMEYLGVPAFAGPAGLAELSANRFEPEEEPIEFEYFF